MNLTRYSPWASQPGLHDELKQVFDKVFGEPEGDQSNVVTSQWMPRVDIKEDTDRFVIFADIPGVEPDHIEIHMENGILTIKGERQLESREQRDRYSRVERSHGLFYRRFSLPDTANPDEVSATGRNGVLEISIPKRPETKPRRITVSNGDSRTIEASRKEH